MEIAEFSLSYKPLAGARRLPGRGYLELSLLGAQRALAADLPLPGGAPLPPSSYYPVSAPVNWGGVYIGLNAGYGFGHSDWTDETGGTGNFAANGGVAGGTLGINYAGFGDWVLLGFEGDFDWSGAKGSASCSNLGGMLTPNATCQTLVDWLATFRLRAGYTWSHFLFYATAGGAMGDFRISELSTGTGFHPTSPLGWTAGVGIEYLFTDSISAKVEYLYVNLGAIECPAASLCSIDNASVNDGKVTFTENLIRAGVNYKFSW